MAYFHCQGYMCRLVSGFSLICGPRRIFHIFRTHLQGNSVLNMVKCVKENWKYTLCEWWLFLQVDSVWAAYKSLFLHLPPFWICLPDMIHFFLFQVLYKEDFERNKGKGFSVVADTPELQRVKKTQDQISNVRHSRNSIYRCASLNITSIAIFLQIWYIHCVLPISFISSRFLNTDKSIFTLP